MSPRSQCPSCGQPIRSVDNVPIVSWLVLRGRCRSCRASISPRYAIVEATTAALFAASVVRFESVEQAAMVALASAVLLALAAIDVEHRRLPNAIVLPAAGAAFVWTVGVSIATGDLGVFLEAVACGLVGFTLLLLIALVSGGMGMGDVKLAAFIGLVTGRFGWPVTVGAIFAGFMLGGVLAILLLIAGRAGRKSQIPFGPSLAAGCVIALFAGPSPVRTWLGV